MRNYVLSFIIPVFLLGCASTGTPPEPSAYRVIKAGSSMELNQALVFLPHTTRVYFQYGRVVFETSVNQYQPHCYLRRFGDVEKEITAQPDRFEIMRAWQRSESVGASFGLSSGMWMIGNSMFDEQGPMANIYTTILDISSAKNPDIEKLFCMEWRDVTFGRHLTLADIQQALGEVITIQP